MCKESINSTMVDISSILLLLVILLFSWLYWKGRKPNGMPPGPVPWPIIGNMDMIYWNEKFHTTTYKLGQKYNGMFSMQYFQMSGLIITDIDIAREAFLKKADIFSDRTTKTASASIFKSTKAIITQNGEKWKRNRKMALQYLREIGFGKGRIEEKIHKEARELIKEIMTNKGQYFSLRHFFNQAVLNIIHAILFDKRMDYHDPEYNAIIESFNTLFKGSGTRDLFEFSTPWTLWFMPIIQPRKQELLKCDEHIRKWILRQIEDHKETFDENHICDLVDLYLKEKQKQPENDMLGIIRDMFLAGSETVSTTLLWTFLFFCKYPDIQTKCREEIRQVMGSREVSYKDKEALPYFEATLCEVMRFGCTAPFTLNHSTAADTTLRGYKIPKDTLVHINLYAIHRDPKIWKDPQTFRPERFLDKDGKKIKNPEAFVPFSLGRRICLGDALARMEHWLFAAEVLQHFEFRSCDPTSQLPSAETTTFGLTLIPDDFYVQAVRCN